MGSDRDNTPPHSTASRGILRWISRRKASDLGIFTMLLKFFLQKQKLTFTVDRLPETITHSSRVFFSTLCPFWSWCTLKYIQFSENLSILSCIAIYFDHNEGLDTLVLYKIDSFLGKETIGGSSHILAAVASRNSLKNVKNTTFDNCSHSF